MGVTATVQCMTQFGLLLSCDSELKSDWDFQLSGSGGNSLNWRKLPGRFSLPKRPGNEARHSFAANWKASPRKFSSEDAEGGKVSESHINFKDVYRTDHNDCILWQNCRLHTPSPFGEHEAGEHVWQ